MTFYSIQVSIIAIVVVASAVSMTKKDNNFHIGEFRIPSILIKLWKKKKQKKKKQDDCPGPEIIKLFPCSTQLRTKF